MLVSFCSRFPRSHATFFDDVSRTFDGGAYACELTWFLPCLVFPVQGTVFTAAALFIVPALPLLIISSLFFGKEFSPLAKVKTTRFGRVACLTSWARVFSPCYLLLSLTAARLPPSFIAFSSRSVRMSNGQAVLPVMYILDEPSLFAPSRPHNFLLVNPTPFATGTGRVFSPPSVDFPEASLWTCGVFCATFSVFLFAEAKDDNSPPLLHTGHLSFAPAVSLTLFPGYVLPDPSLGALRSKNLSPSLPQMLFFPPDVSLVQFVVILLVQLWPNDSTFRVRSESSLHFFGSFRSSILIDRITFFSLRDPWTPIFFFSFQMSLWGQFPSLFTIPLPFKITVILVLFSLVFLGPLFPFLTDPISFFCLVFFLHSTAF